ncbi:MAG: hypothetical protein IJL19_05230 [Clostridiales bacterium]|nr:hypothetical protein [Clostridiales bacterium]
MNVRKVFLILACLCSGLSAFLPYYTVTATGTINGQVINDSATATLFPQFYGIVIVVSAVMVILFTMVGLKKGYVIGSLVNVGASLWGLFTMTLQQDSDKAVLNITGKFVDAFSYQSDYNIDVIDGPGFFMLIFSAVLVLVLMIWNAIGNDD